MVTVIYEHDCTVGIHAELRFVLCSYFTDLEAFPNAGVSVSRNALQGGKFNYDYPVAKSFPNPTTTWTKSGSSLFESQRISFSASGNLYIGNVEVNDAANYQSKVENTVTGQSFNRGTISLGVTGKMHSACRLVVFLKFNKIMCILRRFLVVDGSNH